jgi:hypothetical protein
MITSYEEPTNELRQVRHVVYEPNMRAGSRPLNQPVSYLYYMVQRKWKVQDGEPYYAPEARGLAVQTGGWHPLEPNMGFRWTPVREEWRYLPVVEAKDAK